MNTEQIQKNITRTEKEIGELEERNTKLEQELFEIKKNHKALISDEGQEKVQKLTSSREIIKEVIEEKREKLEALEIELQEAKKEEAKQGCFEACVEATREAAEAKDAYLELVKEVDAGLHEKLLKIADLRAQWSRANKAFIESAIKFEPTFRHNQNETGDSEQIRSEFLQSVDEKAGVSSKHARTELFLPWRSYREIVLGGADYKLDLKTPMTSMVEKVALERVRAKERELQEAS